MRGQGPSQQMRSRPGRLNLRLLQRSVDHLANSCWGERLAITERAEEAARVGLDFPLLQVIGQGPADVLGQGQLALAPSFPSVQANHARAPLDLIEGDGSDFCPSEPQAGQA